MYAIVDIAGQQFKVRQGQQLFVHRLKAEEGSQVSFDKVFLIGKDETIKVGTPVVEGAKVEAKVVEHLKGKKGDSIQKEKKERLSKIERTPSIP